MAAPKDYKELKESVRSLTPAETVEAVTAYLAGHPDDDEALTLRGMRYWSLGNRSAAINDYLAAIRINPDSNAKMLMKSTYDILDYYNKDLYNP